MEQSCKHIKKIHIILQKKGNKAELYTSSMNLSVKESWTSNISWSSVMCLCGDDGSRLPFFNTIITWPVYYGPVTSSRISTTRLTDGIRLNFMKSQSVTANDSFRISFFFLFLLLQLGKFCSPTFGRCLSSMQTEMLYCYNYRNTACTSSCSLWNCLVCTMYYFTGKRLVQWIQECTSALFGQNCKLSQDHEGSCVEGGQWSWTCSRRSQTEIACNIRVTGECQHSITTNPTSSQRNIWHSSQKNIKVWLSSRLQFVKVINDVWIFLFHIHYHFHPNLNS